MVKEFKDKAILKSKWADDLYGGTCKINDDETLKIHENLISIDFNYLYPNLLLQISEEFGDECPMTHEDYVRMKTFLKMRDIMKSHNKDNYKNEKVFVNSFFGNFYRKEMITKEWRTGEVSITRFISEYMHLFYKDLLESHKKDIIYIDTDTIIFKSPFGDSIESKIKKLKIEYSINIFKYFYISAKKKYIYLDSDNEFCIRGYHKRKNNYVKLEEVNSVLGEMKNRMRLDKINKLV